MDIYLIIFSILMTILIIIMLNISNFSNFYEGYYNIYDKTPNRTTLNYITYPYNIYNPIMWSPSYTDKYYQPNYNKYIYINGYYYPR
jgi:hypothetical protein